jgi:hypothetical protein
VVLFGALCGLAALPLGCTGPKTPPSLPIPEAKPVTLPAPAVPTDAALFGYLHVRDPLALFGKLAQLGGVTPEQLAAQRGIKLGEQLTGAPLVGFLWDPQGASLQDVPAVVLAPVPQGGALVTTLQSANPAVRTAMLDQSPGLTALYIGQSGQAHLNSGGPGLLALAQAKQPFDITLYVNAAPILAKYGPILHMGIKALAPALGAAAESNPAGFSPQATMSMLEQMVSSLEELKSFSLGASVTNTALELSTLTTQKQGDGGGPIAAPDLAQFVPPGDVRLQWNTRDIKKLIDWYLRMYGGLLAEKPALRAQVDQAIAEWLKAGPKMQTAMSVSYRNGRGLQISGVMRVDDGPAAMAAVRRSAQLFSSGPVHDAYQSMGLDFSVEHQTNVRKIKGNPVDRYTYKFALRDNGDKTAKPRAQQSMQVMIDKLSGLTYEVAQTGPYLVYSIGAPVDALVESLLGGKGQYPLWAMQTFPAGGSLYAEVDIAGVLDMLRGIIPADTGRPLPILPGANNRVGLWSYDGGAVSYQRLVVPIELIRNVIALAK